DGSTITASASYGISSSWTLLPTRGDFNGDGNSDVVLRNASTGSISIWLMNGTDIIGTGTIDTGHPDWQVLATDADFNADGKSDFLIRENGMVGVWQMNGAAIGSSAEWGAGSLWT